MYLNIHIRTAQHSYIEHIDSIVQGNFHFRMMLSSIRNIPKISTIRKLPALRYSSRILSTIFLRVLISAISANESKIAKISTRR